MMKFSLSTFPAFAGMAVLLVTFATNVSAASQTKADAITGDMKGKYDTKLPVEISANSLEVLQRENKAIFKGNVIAVQGNIHLQADTMTVHYKPKQDSGKKPAGGTGPDGAISLIEVNGNVFATTPEESARGDRGDYKVDEKLLHLTGKNVVLTRGKNVLKGTALEYNLETGHSILTDSANAHGEGSGRVRSVFVPNDEPKKKNKDQLDSAISKE